MKFKSILTGFAAFVAAGSLVYAYQGELQAANAAYRNDANVCIAWNAPGCQATEEEACEISIGGVNRQMLENTGGQPHGAPSDCGNELFRLKSAL